MDSDKEGVLKTIVKGAGIAFTGAIISKILTYLFRTTTGRLLGPEGYGNLSIGLMVFGITTTFASLGLPAGVQRFVSYYKGKKNKKKMKGSFLTALEINIPLSIAISAVLFFSSGFLANSVFSNPQVDVIIKIISLGIPFNFLLVNSTSVTNAFQEMKYRVYSRNIVENLVKLIFAIVLISMGYGIAGAAGAFVIGYAVAAFLALYYAEKVSGFLKSKIDAHKNHKEMLNFSLPLTASRLLGQVTSWTDVFMLGIFSTSLSVGLYNSALPTAAVLGVFVGSFGKIFLPVVTEQHSQNDEKGMKESYETVTKWIFSLTFPMFLLMVFFSTPGLRLLFGKEFLQDTLPVFGYAVPVAAFSLSLLAFGRLANALVGPTGQIIKVIGKTKFTIYISASVATSNVIFNFFLIQAYGVPGAAVATTSSLIIGALTSLILVYKETGIIPFQKSYLKIMGAALISSSAVYVSLKLIYRIIPVWTLVPGFIVFAFLYSFLLLVFRTFDNEDVMIMKTMEQKLGLRIEWLRDIIKRFL